MTLDEIARNLPKWLESTSMSVTEESLVARQTAITALARTVDLESLVAAAFGRSDQNFVDIVEDELRNNDVTYANGKRELVEVVSAITLLTVLSTPGPRATVSGLLVQSAKFLGWDGKLPELIPTAKEVAFQASRTARQRGPFKKGAPLARLKTDGSVDHDALLAAVNATNKRVDELTATIDRRVQLVDEEVNLLWWSRSEISLTVDRPWARLDVLEKASIAPLEIHELLSVDPAPAAARALLLERVGESKKTFTLETFGQAVESRAVVVRDRALLPVLTAGKIAREFADEPTAIAALVRKANLDPELAASPAAYAGQLLRELSIQRLSS